MKDLGEAVDEDAQQQLEAAIENGSIEKDALEEATDDLKDIATNTKKKLTWEEVQAYFKRGNDFNKKAAREEWDKYTEVTLKNGKRLDGYTPPINGELGEIVSRKATDLEKIKPETFESYLKELKSKYSAGEAINAPKYGDKLSGKVLEGKQILEIPESNKNFTRIQEYIDLAKSDKYNIEIRFRPE